jgi:uncharacterized damage-inducible protein DinB
MSSSTGKSKLAAEVEHEFVRYFRHLATRVERAFRALPREQIWVKPFPFGNSVGHLVLHLTGNLNHYIGAGIAGTAYTRDRPKEFTDPSQYPPEEVLERFRQAVDMVAKTVESLDDQGLLRLVTEQHPIQTCMGLLLVCASHMNNHIGQMSYLLQAQGHNTDEPPSW